MFTAVAVVGGLVLLGLVLIGWRGRTAISAQFKKAGRGVWSADPVAVYQAEVDRSADEIRDATGGLEQYRGLVSRLQRQVEAGEKETARLTVRVKAALVAEKQARDGGNATLADSEEKRASEYAVQLKKAQTDLEENRSQLNQYDMTYQNNLKKVRFARQRIEDAKAKAQKLQADLKLSHAEAETAKLAEKFDVRTNTLEGLGEIENEIQRQIDTNRGKAQVASDLSADGLSDIAEAEALQKQEAADVLAKMRSELNLTK